MGKQGFIAYDPALARQKFNADPIMAIYYTKLLRYDEILDKDPNGFFTRSAKQIEQATCIGSKQQDRIREWLVSHAFIQTDVKIPEGKSAPQMHFKVIDKHVVS